MTEVKKLLKDKAKAISLDNFKEAALACNAIGSEFTREEKHEDALQEHMEELNYYEMLGDQLGIAVAHRMIGECYTELNSFKKALHHVRKFYDLSVSLKSTIEEQRALATFGRTYYFKYLYENANGNTCSKTLDQAELAYYKALKLLHNLSSEIKPIELAEMKCRLLLNLGLVHETRGDHKESSKYVKQGLDIALENSLHEDIHRCGYTLGTWYQKFGKHNEAIEVLNTALMAAKKLHDKRLICEAQLAKSINLISLEKNYEAIVCLKSAYKLRTTHNEDQDKIVRHLKISIGINRCEKKLRDCKSLKERKSFLEKIADALSSINCYKLAIEKYLLCLDCMHDDALQEKAPIYYSLAQTYFDDGNVPKALEYFEKECNCHQEEPLEQIKTMWKMAEVLEEEKRMNESEQLYLKAITLAEKSGDSKFIHNSISKVISFYNSTNDVIKAQNAEKKLDAIQYEYQSDEEVENKDESQELFGDIRLSELSDSDNNEEIVVASTTRKRIKNVEKKVNEKGETPLHQACINGNLNLVKRLVESGHSVNVRDYAGWTPLHEACNYGFYDIVEYLLDSGAYINDPGGPDCKGITALHDASSCGNLDVIQLLVARGASVLVKDEDGETPLQALLAWKRRSINELDDVTLRQCKAVEDELRSKMSEAGVHINETEFPHDINMLDSPIFRNHSARMGEKRNRSPSLSSDSDSCEIESAITPPYLNANDDQGWEEADGAKAEYKSVMENLRRSAAAISPVKIQSQRPKIVNGPPLVDENEVVHEWLIKDTNEIPKAKRKKRKINKLNVRTSKRIDNYLISSDPIENEERERFNPLFNEDSNTSINSVNPIDRNAENNLAQASIVESVKVTFCLRVHIANKLILVPVPDDACTVSWLTEEAASRFQNLDGSKPHLILTKNGALLTPSDLVKDIFTNNEEVFSTVEMWDEPSLEDKYVQLCNKRNIAVSSSIRKRFQCLSMSSELDFSNCNVSFSNLSLIFSTLLNYKSLQHLNLSGTALSDSNMREIVACIPSFSVLLSLNVSCCCLTTEILRIFTNYLEDNMSKGVVVLPALKNLDLSYNYFSPCSSFTVFFRLISLVSLNLSSCCLNSSFLSKSMVEAMKENKILEDLDISDSDLGGDGLDELLQNLPRKSLKKLNLSHTTEMGMAMGLKLQTFLAETLPHLTELSLQGCFITNIDLDQIAECLSSCPQLQMCDLSANPLSNFCIHNFINKAYQNNLNISDLNITGTCVWRDGDFISLTDVFKFKTLKRFCFDSCSNNLVDKLIQSWSDKWGQKAAYSNYGFHEFNLK